MSRSNEYHIWATMIQRCYNPAHNSFGRYGGAGVRVCERWSESFENFYADMGPRPSKRHSLDRWPNNNGNYEPGNVRWATRHEQATNKKSTILVNLNGKKTLLADLPSSASYEARRSRFKRGWNIDEIISGKKPQKMDPLNKRPEDMHEFVKLKLTENLPQIRIAELLGVSRQRIGQIVTEADLGHLVKSRGGSQA